MKINELQPRMGKVDLEADVISKEESREFSKFGKVGKVCNAKLKDETGEVKITLWNEQVDQVSLGDRIKITNGYVGEWQGEMQLSTGKFGQMEVISGVKAAVPKQEALKRPSPEKVQEELDIVEEEMM